MTISGTKPAHSTPHLMRHSSSIAAVTDIDIEQQRDADVEINKVHQQKDVVLTAAKNVQPPSPFADDVAKYGWHNMTSASRGAKILFATDEWFASADRLLEDGPPIFDPDAYCPQGKVMDGWETRRRREAGHDWCLIQLATTAVAASRRDRARIMAIEVDTAHFTGNQVPLISLEIATLTWEQEVELVKSLPNGLERLVMGWTNIQGTGSTPMQVDSAEHACRDMGIKWNELLPKTSLKPGYEECRMHYFALVGDLEGTHVRVNYYPDGGVARLRLLGEVVVNEQTTNSPSAAPKMYLPITTGPTCTVVCHGDVRSPETDMPSRLPYAYPELSAAANGGIEVHCSNKHYGVPTNLIQSTLGKDMGDGWETARHPERPSVLVKDPKTGLVASPLMDWCVLKLGSPAKHITRLLLDTKHFRGNYPESVQVEACYVADDNVSADWFLNSSDHGVEWFPLVSRCRMSPDAEHLFDAEKDQIMHCSRRVSHVRVSIYPDGGLSRVRIYGESD